MSRNICSGPFLSLRAAIPLVLLLEALSGCAGNVNDYLEEARQGDPESVKEAVVRIGALLRQKEEAGYPYDAGDDQAIQYLTDVAEKSPDAVNRASAIDSLSHLKRRRLLGLYLSRLDDKAWNVQLEAVKAITRNPDPEAVGPLCRRLDGEIRVEVRLEIVKALGVLGGQDALRKLLELFLDRSARYQNMKLAAYDGLRALSGRDFAFEATEKWRAYLEERFPAPGGKAGGGATSPRDAVSGKPEAEKATPERN